MVPHGTGTCRLHPHSTLNPHAKPFTPSPLQIGSPSRTADSTAESSAPHPVSSPAARPSDDGPMPATGSSLAINSSGADSLSAASTLSTTSTAVVASACSPTSAAGPTIAAVAAVLCATTSTQSAGPGPATLNSPEGSMPATGIGYATVAHPLQSDCLSIAGPTLALGPRPAVGTKQTGSSVCLSHCDDLCHLDIHSSLDQLSRSAMGGQSGPPPAQCQSQPDTGQLYMHPGAVSIVQPFCTNVTCCAHTCRKICLRSVKPRRHQPTRIS